MTFQDATAGSTAKPIYTKEQLEEIIHSMTEEEAAQSLCLIRLMRMEPRDPKFSILFEKSEIDPKPLREFIDTLLSTKAYYKNRSIS